MGLAASQSKLLSLTTRLSRLEYQAQKLSNDKIRMAMESDAISAKSLKALSQKKLTVENGDGNYVTATANKLIDYNALGDAGTGTQRILKDNTGRVIVSQDVADAYKAAQGIATSNSSSSTLSEFLSKNLSVISGYTTTIADTAQETTDISSTQSLGLLNYNYNNSGIETTSDFKTGVSGDATAISLTTSAIAKKLNTTDADTIARAVANTVSYDQLTVDDSLYNSFYKFISAYQNGDLSSDSDEDLAKRLKYFETSVKSVGSNITDIQVNAYMTKALSLSDSELEKVTLTDQEAASGSYIKEILSSSTLGAGCAKDTFNAYAKIKAYQEAWRDSVAYNGATATKESTSKNATTGVITITTSTTEYDVTLGVNKTEQTKKTTKTTITTETPVYDENEQAYYTNVYNGNETFLNQLGYTTDSSYSGTDLKYDTTAVSWYEEIFQEMEDCGYATVSDEQLNDADWLYNNLNMGAVYITEKTKDTDGDGNKDWNEIAWATGDNAIQVEDDDSTQAVAKAEYDREINNNKEKEQKIDVQLKNIDTEHSSIKNEADSTQKIIDKNIERNGKIFEA